MYDQKARSTDTGHEREADAVRHANGKHHPVHLRLGYGRGVSPWIMGKTGGQPRDIQDAFTRFFYSYRRHDWVPVWYQTDGR